MKREIETSNTFTIVDDEKYLTFSNDEMPQNLDFDNASDNVKYKSKEKYQEKILVWLVL